MTHTVAGILLPHSGMATDFLTDPAPDGKRVQMSEATMNGITAVVSGLLLLMVLMAVSYVARKAGRRKW